MTTTTIEKVVYELEASVENAVSGFSKAERSLKGVDSAAEGTTTKLGKVSGAAAGTTTKLRGLTIAVGALMAGLYALTKSATSAIGVFEDYQQAVVNSASVTGAVGDKYTNTVGNIDEVAQAIGKSTLFSATETANAIYDIASAGEDVANLTADQLIPIMNLASGTQYDLTESTELMTGTMASFGMTMDDTQRIADVYTKTVGSSKATMGKLAISQQYAAGTANDLGISLEELNSMLAVMYNRNIDGSKAGTALNAAMADLLKPSNEMKEVYSELCLSLEEMNPLTNDFVDILDRLRESGMDARQATVLFGKDNLSPMLALIAAIPQVRQYEEELKNSMGYAAQVAAQQEDTEKSTKELMQSAIDASKINFGEKMEASMRSIYESITNTTPYIDQFVDKLAELDPRILKIAATIAIVVAALGAAILVIGTLGLAIAGISAGFTALLPVLGAIIPVMASIVLPIAAVVAALYAVEKATGLVSSTISVLRDMLTLIVDAFSTAGAQIKKYFTDKIEELKQWVDKVVEGLIEFFDFLSPLSDAIGELSHTWDGLHARAEAIRAKNKQVTDGVIEQTAAMEEQTYAANELAAAEEELNDSTTIPSYAGKRASYEQVLGVDTAKAAGLSGVYDQEIANQYSKAGRFNTNPTLYNSGIANQYGILAANTQNKTSIPAASTSLMQQTRAPTAAASVTSKAEGTGITKQDLLDAFNGLKEQFVEALKQEPRDVDMTMNVNITNNTGARNLQKQIAEGAARGVTGYSV